MPPPKTAWPKVQYTQTQLGGGTTAQGVSYPGGLDLTTPTLRLPPGALRDVLNFECAQFGGYSRIAGYERVDGQAAPSAASYTVVQIAAGTLINIPNIGDVITQTVSGAMGTTVAVVTSPVPYIVLTMVMGVFDQTHELTIGS